MKRKIFERIGAFVLAMVISLSLVSPCVSYAVDSECPMLEHQHTDECFVLPSTREFVCDVTAHSHDDGCYDAEYNPVCGYSERIIHTHDENCRAEDGTLVCELPECRVHTHTSDCYQEERTLICQENEIPPVFHEHTDACYEEQSRYICGQEEGEDHEHTGECLQIEHILVCEDSEPSLGHVHTESCYDIEYTTVCGKDDRVPHIHDTRCYGSFGEWVCGMLEVVSHQHDDSCFIGSSENRSDVPLCGMQEHTHSEACQSSQDPGLGDDPVIDDPVTDDPSVDPGTGVISSVQYCPIIQRYVDEGDFSSDEYTLTQLAGANVVMPDDTIAYISGSGQTYFKPITFNAEGEYAFRISSRASDEYYDLQVNVMRDLEQLRYISAHAGWRNQ